MRVAVKVKPAFIIESDTIDNKSVPVPMTDRIAHPGRFRILGMRSAVGPDLPKSMLAFKEHKHPVGSLHDLVRLREKEDAGDPRGIALKNRIISARLSLRPIARLRRVVA